MHSENKWCHEKSSRTLKCFEEDLWIESAGKFQIVMCKVWTDGTNIAMLHVVQYFITRGRIEMMETIVSVF